MGSIKNVPIKSLGDELIRRHPERFTTDFDKNKLILGEIQPIKSKLVRNQVAGHITNKMKQAERKAAR